jgi:hypothetical protein
MSYPSLPSCELSLMAGIAHLFKYYSDNLTFVQLIMVGDPAQLPATVLSQTAKRQDYHQSLFKRLFKIFNSGIGPDGKVRGLDVVEK